MDYANQKKVELQKLLEEFNRPVPSEYKHLIDGDPFYPLTTEYTRLLHRDLHKEGLGGVLGSGITWRETGLSSFGKAFRKSIAGREVIDLGCGNSPDLDVLEASIRLGARGYIGVDKEQRFNGTERECPEGFRVLYVKDDILNFVSKIPDKRGNITFLMCGIQPVMGGYGWRPVWSEYMKALVNEMARTSIPGDSLIVDSMITNRYLEPILSPDAYRLFPVTEETEIFGRREPRRFHYEIYTRT